MLQPWGKRIRHLAVACSLVPTIVKGQASPPQAVTTSTEPVVVHWNVPDEQFIDRRTPLEFTLSRALATDEGRPAVMIGSTDVSDLLEHAGTTILYRPRFAPLPSGECEVVVYRRTMAEWIEIRRFALKVLAPGGFVRASVSPSATLGSNGQVAEGRSSGVPEPERPTFQDLTLTSGIRTSHQTARWSVETHGNVSGFSRQDQRLRFAQLGEAAPRVDLADYVVTVAGPRTRLALGHVSVGDHRHLASEFGSRGVTIANTIGATTITLGAVNGTSIVGWDNLIGLDRPKHRVRSATVARELLPKRPGGLRASVSMLDGSLLPEASFTQGAVVDAERSRGFGVQLSGTTAGERIRVAAGYAQSRFRNPAHDPELSGDSILVPIRSETRDARFAEVALGLIQNATVRHVGTVALSTAYRHERIDPLYRSSGTSVQADQQQHAVDVTGTAGIVSVQLAHSRSRDNLDDIPSVLRMTTRQSALTGAIALPTTTRLGRGAVYFPALTISVTRGHQFASSAPTNGAFRPQDLPDQVSVQRELGAQWQLAMLQAAYRYGESEQDNRQPERENADFATRVHSVSVTRPFGAAGGVGLELSKERQHAIEPNVTSRVDRVAATGSWRPFSSTTLTGSLGATLSRDASRGDGSRNTEGRFEIAQSFLRIRRGDPRVQLFLRYASTAARLRALGSTDLIAPIETRRQWTLSSGLNAKVF